MNVLEDIVDWVIGALGVLLWLGVALAVVWVAVGTLVQWTPVQVGLSWVFGLGIYWGLLCLTVPFILLIGYGIYWLYLLVVRD